MIFMALAGCGGVPEPVLKSKTFTANETWPVPAGVTVFTTAIGKGAAGQPATSGEDGYLIRKEYEKRVNGVLTEATTNYEFKYGGPVPGDYCQNVDRSGGIQEKTCYYHTFYEGDTAATTGAAATGFGKTFPGGFGGPASNTTFNNVAVTPLNPYQVIVPAGGSITITYYE